MTKKRKVIFGMIGVRLDWGGAGIGKKRHRTWRPSVALAKQDLEFARIELWAQEEIDHVKKLMPVLKGDIKKLSPKTEIVFHPVQFENPWDFEEVYTKLYDFAIGYPFDLKNEEYYLHITTGTHVMQVCYFALSEANTLPCKLFQTGEDSDLFSKYKEQVKSHKTALKEKTATKNDAPNSPDRSTGIYQIIDLKSEKYQKIASRFEAEYQSNRQLLKSGIDTKNKRYNQIISDIEKVAQLSNKPILLRGPTGAGKTHLAKQIFELKKLSKEKRIAITGKFIDVNCATLRGDGAMSTLFGHKKGAFTGATGDRAGLLKEADGGILFLDEVGELGADEQAMLLKAIEDHEFRPLGSEKYVKSAFGLICGTNRDLRLAVKEGTFREDLLARIDIWEFELPALKERPEDLVPNIEFELQRCNEEFGKKIRFSSEASEKYIKFAKKAEWQANFRDLRGSLTRLATFGSTKGTIELKNVDQEIVRLQNRWTKPESLHPQQNVDLEIYIPEATLKKMTPLERYEIAYVVETLKNKNSLKKAADLLFEGKQNTSDRLRKKLLRYDIDPKSIIL